MRISDWSSDVCSSDLQPELIEQAQNAGKLPKDFRLDPRFTDNTSERLRAIEARHPKLFPEYPLGCDFDGVERDLLRALNRSEEHTSELQSLMRISYAVFCLKKKNTIIKPSEKKIR